MASRTIITEVFRASHPHLKEKKAFNPGDTPAFMIKAMFAQSGTGTIAKTGVSFPSNYDNIMQALREVTLEEWNWSFDPATAQQMGIQFPPNFANGSLKLQKDANGNPLPGVIDPITNGFTLLTMKNTDPVGVVGPDGKDIDPSSVYGGCWCRAQIEVSAFMAGQGNTKSRIIAIKLLNVQMCYDDESFGRGPAQSASEAFAGMAVANTNIAAGTGQVMGAMTAPVAPKAPGAPALPSAPVAPAQPVYVHTATDFPESVYRQDPNWTTELLVAHGKGRMETPKPAAPAVPVLPAAAPVPPTAPVAAPVAPAPTAPINPPAPVAPVAPVTPPQPVAPASVPLTGKVIMKPDSQYTYDQLSKEYGWTDDQIIAGGYATPNYTNPA